MAADIRNTDKELLADIGDIPSELPDYIVIDWDATAERLKVDYTEVDLENERDHHARH